MQDFNSWLESLTPMDKEYWQGVGRSQAANATDSNERQRMQTASQMAAPVHPEVVDEIADSVANAVRETVKRLNPVQVKKFSVELHNWLHTWR